MFSYGTLQADFKFYEQNTTLIYHQKKNLLEIKSSVKLQDGLNQLYFHTLKINYL